MEDRGWWERQLGDELVGYLGYGGDEMLRC